MLRWNSSEQQMCKTDPTMPTPQSLNIRGLPFAGHFYKVTVTARAHYLGKAHSRLLQTNDNSKFNARHVSLFQTKGLISMPVILSGLACVLISVPAVLSDMMCLYFSTCCTVWHDVSLFPCLWFCPTWCVLISMPVVLSDMACVIISVPAVLSDMVCPYFSACMLCCLAWHVSLFQCLTYCQTWCVSTFQCLIYC